MKLLKMPMSMSVNAYLKPRKRDGRLVKTDAAIIYDKTMFKYALIHSSRLDDIKSNIQSKLDESKYNIVHLHRVFYFNEKRIFTKDKKAKSLLHELDTENFLKVNSDAISKMIDIDDRFFKKLTVETKVIENNAPEYIDAFFEIVRIDEAN